uniref:Cleavage and polyadenylation specificity factor subunit 4 n=4 Tax=Cacopsylla melanoneura TaxID=428564 RepID=A0A8D8UY97_9HEMI
MECLVANVENIRFDIEIALENQHDILPSPFPGMDKSMTAVCEFYGRGECTKDTMCPLRHVTGDRSVVCKHWLRGLCKKGDQCEFLHEYDMTKMPECYFYSRFNACHNKECPFLHIDPDSKIKDCPWYDRGFCRHGPTCRHRHVRRVLCMNYVCGFCPDGSDCKFMHPRFELPTEVQTKKLVVVCHFCGSPDHRAMHCPVSTAELIEKEREIQKQKKEAENKVQIANNAAVDIKEEKEELVIKQEPRVHKQPMKAIEDVTCFKCGNKGHYANRCPKGHLAFLTLSNNTKIKSELEAFQARRHLKQEKIAAQNLFMSQQQPQPPHQHYPHGVPQHYPHGMPHSMYHTNLYQ